MSHAPSICVRLAECRNPRRSSREASTSIHQGVYAPQQYMASSQPILRRHEGSSRFQCFQLAHSHPGLCECCNKSVPGKRGRMIQYFCSTQTRLVLQHLEGPALLATAAHQRPERSAPSCPARCRAVQRKKKLSGRPGKLSLDGRAIQSRQFRNNHHAYKQTHAPANFFLPFT